jgi:hypothetical protein
MKKLQNKEKLTCREDKPRGRKAKCDVLEPKPNKTNGRKKNKQKLTCREDKPRGRKEKCDVLEPEASEPNKTNGRKREFVRERDGKCLLCGEHFSDSAAGERWIECKKCKGWCHEECTDGETSKGFKCDFCR